MLKKQYVLCQSKFGRAVKCVDLNAHGYSRSLIQNNDSG